MPREVNEKPRFDHLNQQGHSDVMLMFRLGRSIESTVDSLGSEIRTRVLSRGTTRVWASHCGEFPSVLSLAIACNCFVMNFLMKFVKQILCS